METQYRRLAPARARVYGKRKRNVVGPYFRARGYFISTLGRDEAMIRQYLRNQEKVDERLKKMKRWQCVATVKGAEKNRGRANMRA